MLRKYVAWVPFSSRQCRLFILYFGNFRSLLSRLDVSSALSPVAMSVVSSAKMCGVDSRSLIMSFMNRIKSNGPSLEPCGTPASTGCSEDSAPSTTVLAFLLLRYDFSRSSDLPLMFICLSLASRALCQTASNAAEISRKQA